jgi:hypothetical protein
MLNSAFNRHNSQTKCSCLLRKKNLNFPISTRIICQKEGTKKVDSFKLFLYEALAAIYPGHIAVVSTRI